MKLTIHIDGGSRGNPGPAAAGVVVRDEGAGKTIHAAGYFLGELTNNVAEYNALLRALGLVAHLKADQVKVISDSELMVRQVQGEYKVKSPDLRPLWSEAMRAIARIAKWEITHVRRHLNQKADELCNRALDAKADVILISCDGTGVTASPEPVVPGPDAGISFIASLTAPPGPQCPLPPNPGKPYEFGPGTPAGFCIHAAATVLAHGLSSRPASSRVGCQRCGAPIEVQRPE